MPDQGDGQRGLARTPAAPPGHDDPPAPAATANATASAAAASATVPAWSPLIGSYCAERTRALPPPSPRFAAPAEAASNGSSGTAGNVTPMDRQPPRLARAGIAAPWAAAMARTMDRPRPWPLS